MQPPAAWAQCARPPVLRHRATAAAAPARHRSRPQPALRRQRLVAGAQAAQEGSQEGQAQKGARGQGALISLPPALTLASLLPLTQSVSSCKHASPLPTPARLQHKKHKKQGGKVKERDREQERLVKEAKRFLKQSEGLGRWALVPLGRAGHRVLRRAGLPLLLLLLLRV